MIEWMKKNRKELLLPFLCFVLGLLLAIASIQVQEQGTDTKEDQTLTHFQPKDYKNLVSKEQEIKQFKWTIEAVANLKVRLKQSQQPGTRLETVVTEWGIPDSSRPFPVFSLSGIYNSLYLSSRK